MAHPTYRALNIILFILFSFTPWNSLGHRGGRCTWASKPKYSKNCKANSFMRVRHVPPKGTLWGGNLVATVRPTTAHREPTCNDSKFVGERRSVKVRVRVTELVELVLVL